MHESCILCWHWQTVDVLTPYPNSTMIHYRTSRHRTAIIEASHYVGLTSTHPCLYISALSCRNRAGQAASPCLGRVHHSTLEQAQRVPRRYATTFAWYGHLYMEHSANMVRCELKHFKDICYTLRYCEWLLCNQLWCMPLRRYLLVLDACIEW